MSANEDRGFVDLITYTDASSLSPGTISGVQAICSGGNPANLASVTTPQVYSSSANYQWEYSSNGSTGWTDIGGATSLSYNPPGGLTQDRYYRRRTQDLCGNTDYSSTIQVTVNSLPNGSLAGGTTICEGNTTNLTFNATAGSGPWDIIYNGNSLTNISSRTSISVAPTGNTSYVLSAITDDNGCVRTSGFWGQCDSCR